MPNPTIIELTAAERSELEALRDQDGRPYLRERAAAILKVADGQSARSVARTGLLKPREPDTVYRWIKRYRQAGIAGLEIRGRGRKPAFSP
jgi:transposase